MTITILQLYPDQMNLYGDWGNVLTLKKRLEWRGYSVRIINHGPNDATDFSSIDIVVGGGGQDSGQTLIQDDLLAHQKDLAKRAENGTPMLLVCGMYQLFGRSFLTSSGETIQGIGVLPIETRAGSERMIGNITIDSPDFGQIVGYENHSGQTFLDEDATPLGRVIRGGGNNLTDDHEGIRHHNIIATYLHGPILPKNPRLADFLIDSSLKNRGVTTPLDPLQIDELAQKAHQSAAARPR